MSSPTEVYLPPDLPYPIKVISLDVNTTASISRGTRLLSYSFVYTPAVSGAKVETRFGTWDSSTEGVVDVWSVRQGDVITLRRAREKPVILVTEPCKHGVQIGGLCGLCGKDMTAYDYTGYSDSSRASIQMTHSAFGPTVSLEEAQRIERETAEHLLKSRKLSLIVDLDQTIVHATVDPTVGEWISEGEAWETRQSLKASKDRDSADDDADDDDSSDTSSDSDDECNPNWEALKDVKKFRLGPESFGAPLPRGFAKGKQKLLQSDGCMYYVKPRPGLQAFLQEVAKKYEMHIYTMGTRAYAEEVCSAIDPDRKLFGGRILSRDESGSLTQKNLRRLFPCDTSMVVIIDDRADVWEWSPNLIKVVPYDFFVGIGDINSTFLPKAEGLAHSVPPPSGPGEASPSASSSASSSTQFIIEPSPPEAGVSAPEEKALLAQALEAQLEQRPLAKKQEELEEAEARHLPQETKVAKGTNIPEPSKHEKVAHHALLKNDDAELERLRKLLDEVHRRFYAAYDSRVPDSTSQKRRRVSFSMAREPPPVSYDVTQIIPRMRSEILDGVHILYSSVIPLDTPPETTEIWRLAHMFGATCYTELNNSITHVVAAKRGTVKVDAARKRGGIKIVWLSWFTDSIALWRRQDEGPYLLDDPAVTVGPSSSPTADYHQISSDPDPDTDDWDEADGGTGGVADPFAINSINWADINDEVEAAMNESDDDDDDDDDDDSASGVNASDDDAGNQSAASATDNTPRLKRKRLRSATPSEVGLNGSSNDDSLQSPLAKRKKLAAGRSGYSKLKEAISADDLDSKEEQVEPVSVKASPQGTNEGDSEDDADDEDDFLARELEEEWG